jgi:hypothetical protein
MRRRKHELTLYQHIWCEILSMEMRKKMLAIKDDDKELIRIDKKQENKGRISVVK